MAHSTTVLSAPTQNKAAEALPAEAKVLVEQQVVPAMTRTAERISKYQSTILG